MKGWGSIRPRHAGYELDIMIGGRRVRELFPSRELAEKALKKLQRQKALGIESGVGPWLLYRDVIPHVLDEYRARGYRGRTLDAYRSEMARVEARWGDLAVSQTRQADILAWIRELQVAGLSASTIRHFCDRLSQCHRYVEREAMLPAPPCRVPRPRLETAERLPISETDLERLVAEAGRSLDRRVLLAILMAADAGLRAAEIVALAAEDVRLDTGWLQVRAGKGGRDRSVPIATQRLREALGLVADLTGPVLAIESRWQLYPVLRHVWRRALGTEPQLHRLRHRFATIALSSPDVAFDDVRRWLGHSGLATTARYAHLRHASVPTGVRSALAGRGHVTGQSPEADDETDKPSQVVHGE